MDEKEFEGRLIEEVIISTCVLPEFLKSSLERGFRNSKGIEKKVFSRILENIEIAEEKKIPVCQDTGVFEIWFKVGKDFRLNGLDLSNLAVRAVQKAHEKGGLRESMIDRIMPVVHVEFFPGKTMEVVITPRGFGSENYTFLHMLPPESGLSEIKKQVLEDVVAAGGRPCPPYVIGVGLGGTATKALEMSAFALTQIEYQPQGMEKELVDAINGLGVGAGGMGGEITALGAKIINFPRHIAGLALGVHIGCWCNRVRSFSIEEA